MIRLFRKRKKKTSLDIRPTSLEDFRGQFRAKQILYHSLNGVRMRREPLDHVIIYGPPGTGKTTLAHIIAGELRKRISVYMGPSLQKKEDIVAMLDDIHPGEILFIDEIHIIPAALEELLYDQMEDGPDFTLIGATTKLGNLSDPLRDRFGIQLMLEHYEQEDMEAIAERTAKVLDVGLEDTAKIAIASRSRGTPRILNMYLRRARDVAAFSNKSTIDGQVATETFRILGIDELGLDAMDRQILTVMIDRYEERPVGLKTLAISVGEYPRTVQEVYEPYLIKSGLILPTSRGRTVTEKAIQHIRKWQNYR